MLTEQVYAHLLDLFQSTAYTQAGLLGASFFALALLANRLGRRAAESEELASQRGIDLANLAQLNDFVIQQMRAGILVVDYQGTVELMNEAAWVLLGMPVAMRHFPLAEASPPLVEQFRQWSRDAQTARPDFRATSGGRDLRASFTAIGDTDNPSTLIVLEDRARLAAEAQQAEFRNYGVSLDDLVDSLITLQTVTRHLGSVAGQDGPEAFLADATLYLELFGIVTIAWQWLLQGNAIQKVLNTNAKKKDVNFYHGKMTALRYFYAYELPKTHGLTTRLLHTDGLTVEMHTELFND